MLKTFLSILAFGFVASAASAVTFVPIAGELSVATSSDRRSAAVTISNGGVVAARFCLSFPNPLEEAITLEERGHVLFVPRPIEGLPPSAQINGPELIAQTLTVVPEKSPALAFVAKGIVPIHKGAKPILISNVVRQDASLGSSAEGCAG